MSDPLDLGKSVEVYTSEELDRLYDREITEQKSFSCDYCAKSFPDRDAARGHIERNHRRQVFSDE